MDWSIYYGRRRKHADSLSDGTPVLLGHIQIQIVMASKFWRMYRWNESVQWRFLISKEWNHVFLFSSVATGILIAVAPKRQPCPLIRRGLTDMIHWPLARWSYYNPSLGSRRWQVTQGDHCKLQGYYRTGIRMVAGKRKWELNENGALLWWTRRLAAYSGGST
jgi:hypothetical protein